jgi:hypothetical protein
MGRWRRTTACERAAQWISLELDDMLGELEHAALRRHLARCRACSASRAELAGFTLLIRAAPPVASPARVTVPIPRSRLRGFPRTAVAILAAAAIAASGGFVFSQHFGRTGSLASSAFAFASQSDRRRYVHDEQVRLEPHVFAGVTAGVRGATVAPRVLF